MCDPQKSAEAFKSLSDRERDVLALLVEGRSNREIGGALAISPRTVQAHIASIAAKTGSRGRTALAVAAVSAGAVAVEPQCPCTAE